MNIKLLNPPILDQSWAKPILPQGLGILAAFLKSNYVPVEIDDLHLKFKKSYSLIGQKRIEIGFSKFKKAQIKKSCYSGISNKKIDILADLLINGVDVKNCGLVGITIVSEWQKLSALLLAEKIKKKYKVPIVIGGPHVTLFAKYFFSEYSFIDYAVAGEGEVPLLELVQSLKGNRKIEKVSSLWHRQNGKAIFNGRSIYSIEGQSCPDFEGFSLKDYEKYLAGVKVLHIPYSVTRGCFGKCAFCLYSVVDGSWQAKSIKKVIRDIVYLKEKYKSKVFYFNDAAIDSSYRYLDSLCSEFIEKKINILWSVHVKGDSLDKRLIDKMKKAGCYFLKWGIESGSPRILKMMNKNPDIEHKINMLKEARKNGIKNRVSLIINYPHETPQDLKITKQLIKDNAKFIDWAEVYNLSIYPGAPIFNNSKTIGIKTTKNNKWFLTQTYLHKNLNSGASSREEKVTKNLRKEIIDCCYKNINFKQVRFPLNLMLRIFGLKFKFIYDFLKNYFINSYSLVK